LPVFVFIFAKATADGQKNQKAEKPFILLDISFIDF